MPCLLMFEREIPICGFSFSQKYRDCNYKEKIGGIIDVDRRQQIVSHTTDDIQKIINDQNVRHLDDFCHTGKYEIDPKTGKLFFQTSMLRTEVMVWNTTKPIISRFGFDRLIENHDTQVADLVDTVDQAMNRQESCSLSVHLSYLGSVNQHAFTFKECVMPFKGQD